ncbi:hypothetical protein FHS89_002616 [Rubricella aquisinus]|uniref:DUF4357 domain-containing protein n=1 Tax=Rubricella aquisinus TaxID=2028108 RepID=A0A840X419_9RHOB|nr:GIY-YIG nuclease family protein [Rubricella aquisinus]MBB5516585.1 hypothetical protein [Rubricella aquisinus]
MSRGRSLELFFVDGTPDGILTAEIFGWTGHVLKAPRTRIAEALRRRQAQFTGIYLLIGEQEGQPALYVGEGEDVAARIRSHDVKKDWWQDVIILTTGADSLHKAHVRYLEARLVDLARRAGRVRLDNGNTPGGASLSEAAQANMEEFIETLGIVLPAIGVDLLQSGTRPDVGPSVELTEQVERFRLTTPRHGIDALAELRGAEFVVLKGAKVRGEWAGKGNWDFGYAAIATDLCARGVIDTSRTPPEFTDNYAFNSPSAAASVVNGRPANGRQEWKHHQTGQSFADWEEARLGVMESEEPS